MRPWEIIEPDYENKSIVIEINSYPHEKHYSHTTHYACARIQSFGLQVRDFEGDDQSHSLHQMVSYLRFPEIFLSHKEICAKPPVSAQYHPYI